jgi:hypothetical protein
MASVEYRTKTRTGTAALLIGAAALASAMPGDAHATIEQEASVLAVRQVGAFVTDEVTSPPDALRGVSAASTGPGYSVEASVGPFGNLGIAAQMTGTGLLYSLIAISNDEFINPLAIPQHAEAFFIIDGGGLGMLAGPGSRLTFDLVVAAVVADSNGLPTGERSFASSIALEQTAAGLEFHTTGASLGATFDPTIGGGFQVDIPLSLQSLGLGLIPASGRIELSYVVTIEADTQVFSEFVAYQFSDPLRVDGTGEFPTVIFSDPAAVAEPPALLALAASLALLGATRRRRTAATPPCGRTAATVLLGMTALVNVVSGDAHATIAQSAYVEYSNIVPALAFDSDEVMAPPDVLRGVSAQIVGQAFSATASIGDFGNLGTAGLLGRTGTLQSQLGIFSDEFVNPLSTPQRAQTQFVIDGGRLP